MVSIVQSYAQAVMTPRNMALGGGGSTYITSYNANFYNPANLMIQDRHGDFEIGFLAGGFQFKGLQNYKHPATQFENALQYVDKYRPGNYQLDQTEINEVLDNNYNSSSTLSNNSSRYDATPFGVKWKRPNHAFSIAFRTRTASDFEIGRGWYDTSFYNIDDQYVVDRTLIHRYQSLHEISFGYAETFRFLTNLTSRLDNFIIGVAPKLVIGGNYQDAIWENEYYRTGLNEYSNVESFYFAGSGQIGKLTTDFLNSNNPEKAISNNTSTYNFDTYGVGAGLDIGITYLLTFGSDLSAVRPGQNPTQKSLRLSFSMTDIGFVSYTKDLEKLSFLPDTTQNVTPPSNKANQAFVGGRGQFIHFIDQFAQQNPFFDAQRERASFSILLPMALHGGALLELNRVKLMGDVSVGLTDNAFNSTTLVSAIGIELRPLLFLPLRAGAQFEAQRPRFLSLGTAIETKSWDFSVAAQFSPRSIVSEIQLTGISVATLQFHF